MGTYLKRLSVVGLRRLRKLLMGDKIQHLFLLDILHGSGLFGLKQGEFLGLRGGWTLPSCGMMGGGTTVPGGESGIDKIDCSTLDSDRGGSGWVGEWERSHPAENSAIFMGCNGLVVPAVWGGGQAKWFGTALRMERRTLRAAVGRRNVVGELLDAYWDLNPPPKEENWVVRNHLLMCLTGAELSDGNLAPVRKADANDLEFVFRMSVRMREEELGYTVPSGRLAGIQNMVRNRINKGCVYVLDVNYVPVFKVETGINSPWGVHLEGVYTTPQFRNRGLATSCLRYLCHMMLANHPFVSLHVWEQNHGAVQVYQALGFRTAHLFRIAVQV